MYGADGTSVKSNSIHKIKSSDGWSMDSDSKILSMGKYEYLIFSDIVVIFFHDSSGSQKKA